MPVITVDPTDLFERLGEKFTEEEFENLCFSVGLELDDVINEPDGQKYKIEIPANRYDLLCIEGLTRALRFFLKKETKVFEYKAVEPENMLKVIAKKSVSNVRPHIVCAVLRGVTLNKKRYDSLIELQDKLHHNICRQRKLASIGTYDLDTLTGPITYEALPPEQIKFMPLNHDQIVDGHGLMKLLSKHDQLKHYLHLIKDSPTYPFLHDSKGNACSLPPIINGDPTKITLNTKNIFIDVTAQDWTKANIVLETICLMFSEYTTEKFVVEKVQIEYEDGKTYKTPFYNTRVVSVPLDYLKRGIGVEVEKEKIPEYLLQMQLESKLNGDAVEVTVPPLRSDILHPCDILEDVAIAYGYGKIVDIAEIPKTPCYGVQQPLNAFTDLLRRELSNAGFFEVLSFSLCSTADNYEKLNRPNDNKGVIVGNPQTSEFEMIRTSLYPGLLKTARKSKHSPLPIDLFEVSDIAVRDPNTDVGSSNKRHLAAIHVSNIAEFETIHGLLDIVMEVTGIPHKSQLDPKKTYKKHYYLKPHDSPTYVPGRCAQVVIVYENGTEKVIGDVGIFHPKVMEAYQVPITAAFEVEVEPLF